MGWAAIMVSARVTNSNRVIFLTLASFRRYLKISRTSSVKKVFDLLSYFSSVLLAESNRVKQLPNTPAAPLPKKTYVLTYIKYLYNNIVITFPMLKLIFPLKPIVFSAQLNWTTMKKLIRLLCHNLLWQLCPTSDAYCAFSADASL